MKDTPSPAVPLVRNDSLDAYIRAILSRDYVAVRGIIDSVTANTRLDDPLSVRSLHWHCAVAYAFLPADEDSDASHQCWYQLTRLRRELSQRQRFCSAMGNAFLPSPGAWAVYRYAASYLAGKQPEKIRIKVPEPNENKTDTVEALANVPIWMSWILPLTVWVLSLDHLLTSYFGRLHEDSQKQLQALANAAAMAVTFSRLDRHYAQALLCSPQDLLWLPLVWMVAYLQLLSWCSAQLLFLLVQTLVFPVVGLCLFLYNGWVHWLQPVWEGLVDKNYVYAALVFLLSPTVIWLIPLYQIGLTLVCVIRAIRQSLHQSTYLSQSAALVLGIGVTAHCVPYVSALLVAVMTMALLGIPPLLMGALLVTAVVSTLCFSRSVVQQYAKFASVQAEMASPSVYSRDGCFTLWQKAAVVKPENRLEKEWLPCDSGGVRPEW